MLYFLWSNAAAAVVAAGAAAATVAVAIAVGVVVVIADDEYMFTIVVDSSEPFVSFENGEIFKMV